jgi:methionine--tRNA ligase beta chain
MFKNYLKKITPSFQNFSTFNNNLWKCQSFKINQNFFSSINKNFTEKKKGEEDKTVLFQGCELRVGKVLDIQDMENSEDILCLKIDLGETTRDVGSGLRKFIPHSDFKGKNVIVFCNLKPKKLGGYVSNGMILCASNEEKNYFELLRPSESKYYLDF